MSTPAMPLSSQYSVLTIAADATFADELNQYLGQHGLDTEHACSVAAARALLASGRHDLVLLDLPTLAPAELAPAHELRLRTRTPFILLAHHATSAARVTGLDCGAADCLNRPFVPRELLARVRAVLRRCCGELAMPLPLPASEPEALLFGGWVLQTLTRRLTSPTGHAVALSSAEFLLLQAFLDAPQRLLSREQLMARARQRDGEPVHRSIDLLVSRLRHKLTHEGAAAPLIRTVRGHGYVLDSRPMPIDPQG